MQHTASLDNRQIQTHHKPDSSADLIRGIRSKNGDSDRKMEGRKKGSYLA